MSGEDLRYKLQNAGMTFTDVASRLGMTQPNLSATFRVADVKTGLLERICEAYNLPMSFFYPEGAGIVANNSSVNNVTAPVQGDVTSNTGASVDTIQRLLDEVSAQRQQNDKLLDMLKAKM